ncbi:MAG: TRAP transporter TatT component family protein [Desulfobacteraceae bacterium]|nr:TRAP transporter TatT component family protein [Desulfobacteraceae bacterium]
MMCRLNVLKSLISFFIIISIFTLTSCSAIVSSALSGMMDNLSTTILNNNDLEMVETGAPAYLLMIDSMVKEESDNEEMLISAAVLYTAYADTFVSDKQRARKMADKALGYANRALCSRKSNACSLNTVKYEKFQNIIEKLGKKDIPALFTLGSSWASWIRANSNDFNAIADISRIEIIMQRVVELDETYKDGAAFLYLGISATLLPPALGGQPEKGRKYFEKAIKLSKGKNFMIKVIFAKQYARMLFDRDLHDKLLKQVLDRNPVIQGYTLVNTYAQKQARQLLESADEYF